MKKKILSIALAAAMAVSTSAIVTAEENNPSIYVNGAEIEFNDQKAIIQSDRTLVPLRGVFEAMEAKVEWNGDERKITVDSKDNIKHIILKIDDPEMEVYTFKSLRDADLETVTLDVPPQIMSDRTLVPLRAISESLNADVQWNQEEYRVDITFDTKAGDDTPLYSLSTDTEAAAAGETFDIYLNAKNVSIGEGAWVTGAELSLSYDKESFELVETAMLSADGTPLEGAFGDTNSDYSVGALKTAYVTIDEENAVKADGIILKLTFKSLKGQQGEFAISNTYDSVVGYANVLYIKSGGYQYEFTAANGLTLDTTPIVIGASDTSAVTAE